MIESRWQAWFYIQFAFMFWLSCFFRLVHNGVFYAFSERKNGLYERTACIFRLNGSNTNCVYMSIISIMTTFYGQDNTRVGFIMMNNMVCVHDICWLKFIQATKLRNASDEMTYCLSPDITTVFSQLKELLRYIPICVWSRVNRLHPGIIVEDVSLFVAFSAE